MITDFLLAGLKQARIITEYVARIPELDSVTEEFG